MDKLITKSFKRLLDKGLHRGFITHEELAKSLGSRGIVVITRRGLMADLVCNCRPVYSNIYAFTNVSQARRTMMMGRGVRPFRIAFSQDPEKTLQTAFNVLKAKEGFLMNLYQNTEHLFKEIKIELFIAPLSED